tara:strand:- start:25 stop:930 length:906 start_codon:yes stop_codon:yes gene_type:complete
MKWIGQYIQDFVSRFRNDVYLENIADGTVASDKFLGLDSNNKIVKETITSSSGDITAVNITTDSGGGEAKAAVASGDAEFSILGTSGVGVTNSNEEITVTSVPGEIDHDSLLNFNSNEHFTQANITTVGTIGTGVWQGTAIASAYLDADTAHYSAQKQFTYHGFTIDMDTTKQYIGLLDADSETTSTTNGDLPIVAPVAGKLLKVFLRVNKNQTALTLTFRLETQAAGVTFGTGPTIVGTQSGAGPSTSSMVTYDFTSSLDSGDNIIDAGDTVYLSIQSDGATSNTKYYITCLWEWDLSSV